MSETQGDNFVMRDEEGDLSVNFQTLVLALAGSAAIHLGESPNPETGQMETHLPLAKQSLDLLRLLKEKTVGNLNADEEKMLTSVVADFQLRYVAAVTAAKTK